jgi:hypothetical protein
MDRWAVDLFSWDELCLIHPFRTLALTSKRCRDLVEQFCSHLVRSNNVFKLPFSKLGNNAVVYPDLSGIVYRRLHLQCAPRLCVFCHMVLWTYPNHKNVPILPCCTDCYYAQVFVSFDLHLPSHYISRKRSEALNCQTPQEVEKLYHLSEFDIQSNNIRGTEYGWALRVDIEALALRLYGTREFHSVTPKDEGAVCAICERSDSLGRIMAIRSQLKLNSDFPVRSTVTEQDSRDSTADNWPVLQALQSWYEDGVEDDEEDDVEDDIEKEVDAGYVLTFMNIQ